MISYVFELGEGLRHEFVVDETRSTSEEVEGEQAPEWTALDRYTCPFCPLEAGSRRSCPAALAIRPVVEAFDMRLSFEEVRVTVVKGAATTCASVPAQHAVRSLLGLLLPLSDCPVMMLLRPMALLHQPLSDATSTAFRFVGMHLIVQYLRQARGREPDWELRKLLELVERVHGVNRHLADRIRAATHRDAAVNALVGLDGLAESVAWTVEDSMEQIEPLFAIYFSDLEGQR